MAILLNIVLGIYVLVALLMVFVILMQRPKSEGLGAAFGGGVTDNLFGAQTTNVLTKITGWLAGIFFALTFLLSILYAQRTNAGGGLRKELMRSAPAAAVPAISPGAANSENPAPPAAPAQDAVTAPAPAGDAAQNQPALEGGNSPTAADMAVGAVQPVPAPAASAPAASPAATP
jgi:preprotein translocase subunit SecG